MRCGLYIHIAPAQKIDKSFITIFTEKLNFYLCGVVWLSMTSSWGEFQATLGWPNSSVHEVVKSFWWFQCFCFFKRSKSNKTHPTLDDDPNWQIISICLKPQIARQFGEAKLPEAHWRRRAGPAPRRNFASRGWGSDHCSGAASRGGCWSKNGDLFWDPQQMHILYLVYFSIS